MLITSCFIDDNFMANRVFRFIYCIELCKK